MRDISDDQMELDAIAQLKSEQQLLVKVLGI